MNVSRSGSDSVVGQAEGIITTKVELGLMDRYTRAQQEMPMSGVQALARLPLEQRWLDRTAGLRTAAFISGYEGSPLGGYDLELQRIRHLLEAENIEFSPGTNEELAATAAQGAQLASASPTCTFDGVTSYWYGKSPGLDRAADALRHANLMGTHHRGGGVLFVGDDPAAKSSTVPGSSDALLADLGIPVLYPADPAEVIELGLHAVAMSRASGLWCALKIVTGVADGSMVVPLRGTRDPATFDMRNPKGMSHTVVGTLLQPHLTPLERSRDGERLSIAQEYVREHDLDQVRGHRQDSVGIVAAGKTYRDVTQALRTLGLDESALEQAGIRLLQMSVTFPVDRHRVGEFSDGLRNVLVVEEKRGALETALREGLYGSSNMPRICGKHDLNGAPLVPREGELDADIVRSSIERFLESVGISVPRGSVARPATRSLIPVASRSPHFCSGCPHNSSTKVPEGALVGGGIGCHGLVLTMEEPQVGKVTGLTQMGGEGAQWIGMSPFVSDQHIFQNLGDGTYHHSGSLAIRAAVASGVNLTYKILYNSAVAMTGGQRPTGQMSIAEMTFSLMAEGVDSVVITTEDPKHFIRNNRLAPGTTVRERADLIPVQEELAKRPGVTVLIHDQECAIELRRKRKRGTVAKPEKRVVINERVCEGCGDCGKVSNCLSVQPVATEFGRKTRIDQSSCNSDYTCLDGDCPAFVSVVPAGGAPVAADTPSVGLGELTPPRLSDEVGQGSSVGIRVLGVGGSGVVTLSQILGTAAILDGKYFSCLDQTGLAQKGGAVISDIVIAAADSGEGARIGSEECDVYIGADILVAADAKNLSVTSETRTVAIVSSSAVPTGAMVVDPSQPPIDTAGLLSIILERCRSGSSTSLDARRDAELLFGDSQSANLLLVGSAFQLGVLPISEGAIEDAIHLNGVLVEKNIQAFRWGRLSQSDPDAYNAALTGGGNQTAPRTATPAEVELADSVGAVREELRTLLTDRVRELVAYQDADYAQSYIDFLTEVARSEAAVSGNEMLTEAVARHLYKLMAYKDEYEVARLLTDPGARDDVTTRFGPGARVAYNLHPPVLRWLGMQRKIRLGRWAEPGLRLLARLKWMRGRAVDPFGWSRVRRTERRLVAEYKAEIRAALSGLTLETLPLVIELAELPDMVRGYEEIKLGNVDKYALEVARLKAALHLPS